MKVRIVNPPVRKVATQAVSERNTPVMRQIPVNVSTSAKVSPMTSAAGLRNPVWKKFKYSFIINAVPTGSMSFRTPAPKNTNPRMTAQSRLAFMLISLIIGPNVHSRLFSLRLK